MLWHPYCQQISKPALYLIQPHSQNLSLSPPFLKYLLMKYEVSKKFRSKENPDSRTWAQPLDLLFCSPEAPLRLPQWKHFSHQPISLLLLGVQTYLHMPLTHIPNAVIRRQTHLKKPCPSSQEWWSCWAHLLRYLPSVIRGLSCSFLHQGPIHLLLCSQQFWIAVVSLTSKKSLWIYAGWTDANQSAVLLMFAPWIDT